jgi:hypothetical protein
MLLQQPLKRRHKLHKAGSSLGIRLPALLGNRGICLL